MATAKKARKAPRRKARVRRVVPRRGRAAVKATMTPFARAYIDMAVGSELDRRAVLDDISPATLRQMTLDANEFYRDNRAALGRSLRPSELDTIALDFWNARNGHGAGFIGSEDRFGEGGGSLAASARRFGKYELREGDDGRIYGRSVRPAKRRTSK